MQNFKIFVIAGLFVFLGCKPPSTEHSGLMEVKQSEVELAAFPFVQMTKAALNNKVLGTLVGSAIGDAMGAPTEMWARNNIRVEYGYVDSLTDMVREPSPEGTWDYNLPVGGTTDDTRWKVLLTEFIKDQNTGFFQKTGPNAYAFAGFLTNQYLKEVEAVKNTESFDPAPFEQNMRRMAWLQEWALVSKPYADKDLEGYMNALSRFYGGEMVCAGLLYTPAVGMVFPGSPENAYQAAYCLSIFDLGYARDISALTASLVAAAMIPEATPESMIEVLKNIDPNQYFRSRLVGRSSYRIWRDALYFVDEVNKMESSLEEKRQKLFELLDAKAQDFPFHAGEIHLINLTAMLFCDFDFRASLAFVTNYGRDNDTVGAVTGAILGALHGFDGIPEDMKQPVLETNRKKLGIDLEQMAAELTDLLWQHGVVGE